MGKQKRRLFSGSSEEGGFRSKSYLRYFEGYTKVTRIDERGRTVTERVYRGTYYEPDLPHSQRILLRLLYVLLFVGAAVLFLICATRAAVCNSVAYVNVLQALSLPLFVWCLCALILYVPFAGKLTVGEYHSQRKSLTRSTLWTALCIWVVAVVSIVSLIHMGGSILPNLLCAAGFAASGGMIFLIGLLERRLNYVTSDSK